VQELTGVKMTTPQNKLYNLYYKIQELARLLETEEGQLDIFEHVKLFYIGRGVFVKRLDTLQDQMSLIIKLLSKEHGRERKTSKI
jgi:hypothetical protein